MFRRFSLRRRATPSPIEIDPAVLLGRGGIELDTPQLQRFIAGKRVMVTGAGGSIGSEICRQAARFCPSSLVLVERSEAALFAIDHELRQTWIGLEPTPLLLDVADELRVRRAFETHRPQVVFHAAAHKHVPLMEQHAAEAVRNNVFGTLNVSRAADEIGSEAFVLISTDKAVNPSSIMGATKRVAELAVLGSPAIGLAAERTGTRHAAVRFGNVLGSSGSVVPIFLKQIAAGGPVTVTHEDMRRYFMTIPEASQLVMQAGAIGRGDELFVLDMGEPIRIYDLAVKLIELHGLRVGRDIELRVTGIRPGEKLYEELSYTSEHTRPSGHDRILIWQQTPVTALSLETMLADLHDAAARDDDALTRSMLSRHLPEFASPEASPLKLVA